LTKGINITAILGFEIEIEICKHLFPGD